MVGLGVSILVLMVSILLLVGLQVTLSELKAMDIRAVGTVLVFTYVVGPIIGLLLSVTLRLRRSWAVAILVWCSTPQMSRTSVSTAVVGGNVSLALTATLVSMAASMVATPVVLELSVLVFNALSDGGGADGQNVEVDLPVLKILAALCILLAVAGFGVFANEKLAAGTIEALSGKFPSSSEITKRLVHLGGGSSIISAEPISSPEPTSAPEPTSSGADGGGASGGCAAHGG